MKIEKLKHILSDKLTLFSTLTGILFLVNEIRKNGAYYSIKELALLIFIILTFTYVVEIISKKIIKNKIKAALVATLFIAINLFYQDLFRVLLSYKTFINSISSYHPAVIIFFILLLIWLAAVLLILKIKTISPNLNLYFNLILIAFVLVEIFKWISTPRPHILLSEKDPFEYNSSLRPDEKPDIYFIILDSYTSSESLKKYWDYDNSAFEDSLKKAGFIIPVQTTTNYTITHYCLASYLNSSGLLIDSSLTYNERDLLQLISHSRLYDWLKANGYYCNNLSPFDAFGQKKYMTGFYFNSILGRTIWYASALKMQNILKPSSTISQTNLRIFSELNKSGNQENNQPKFTYAHLMMPHRPYFFDKNGTTIDQNVSLPEKQKYLGQLIYTNTLALNSVRNILRDTKRNKIIIIQGDHGFRDLDNIPPNDRKKEGHTIFYAIYTPEGIFPTGIIGPMNTFKLIIDRINNQEHIR